MTLLKLLPGAAVAGLIAPNLWGLPDIGSLHMRVAMIVVMVAVAMVMIMAV